MIYFLRPLAYAAITAAALTGCPEPVGCKYELGEQMLSCLASSARKEPVNQYGVNCSAVAHFVADDESLEACVRRVVEEGEPDDSCPESCSLVIAGQDPPVLGSQWISVCDMEPTRAWIVCETAAGSIMPDSIAVPNLPGFQDVPF